jgi:hypothetical protein
MRATLILLTLALLGCQQQIPHRDRPADVSVARNADYELQASYTRVAGAPALHFTLKWLSREPVDLYPFELPWGNSHSLELWARDASGEELQGYYFIDDPPFQSPVTLSHGKVLEGTFLLSGRFPRIAGALRQSSVVVMWRYPHRSSKDRPRESVTGRLVIAQEGP